MIQKQKETSFQKNSKRNKAKLKIIKSKVNQVAINKLKLKKKNKRNRKKSVYQIKNQIIRILILIIKYLMKMRYNNKNQKKKKMMLKLLRRRKKMIQIQKNQEL